MEDSNGNVDSFFILQADETLDEVLANPEAFVGRKCTVKWKTSKENIPEAGGMIDVKQILSVEWVPASQITVADMGSAMGRLAMFDFKVFVLNRLKRNLDPSGSHAGEAAKSPFVMTRLIFPVFMAI